MSQPCIAYAWNNIIGHDKNILANEHMTYENSFDTLSKEDKLDKDIRQTVAAYH